MRKKFLVKTMLVLFSAFLFAETNAFDIPDSAQVRSGLREIWFEASLTTVRNNKPQIYRNKVGEEFQVRLEEAETTFNVFVSPKMTMRCNC